MSLNSILHADINLLFFFFCRSYFLQGFYSRCPSSVNNLSSHSQLLTKTCEHGLTDVDAPHAESTQFPQNITHVVSTRSSLTSLLYLSTHIDPGRLEETAAARDDPIFSMGMLPLSLHRQPSVVPTDCFLYIKYTSSYNIDMEKENLSGQARYLSSSHLRRLRNAFIKA